MTRAFATSIIALACALTSARAQTQAEMNKEARQEFEQADALMNKVYKSLLASLSDDESKTKLQQSQRAWISYRDSAVAFAVHEVEGGTLAPTVRYTVMAELTEQRTKTLQSSTQESNGESLDSQRTKPRSR